MQATPQLRLLGASEPSAILLFIKKGAVLTHGSLSTNPDLPVMKTISYEAESATGGVSQTNVHCSGGSHKTRIGNSVRLGFINVKAEVAGEYALTLYYLLPSDSRQAYVQVGLSGDRAYYDFHALDDYDRSKGLVQGMKTVYVQLEAGINRIYFGNENGTAPDLDKITITPTWATQQAGTDAITTPQADDSGPLASMSLSGSTVHVNTIVSGSLHVFSLDGRKLHAIAVPAGESQVTLHHLHGPVILSLAAGTHAYARKVILP